jgi:hypothetical protein
MAAVLMLTIAPHKPNLFVRAWLQATLVYNRAELLAGARANHEQDQGTLSQGHNLAQLAAERHGTVEYSPSTARGYLRCAHTRHIVIRSSIKR